MNRALLAALPVFAACSEFNIQNSPNGADVPRGAIEVDPPALQFGELRSGEEEVQTFTVRNVGRAVLKVSDVVIGAGLAFDVLGPSTEFQLLPGEETTVDVRFTPMEANENFGQVLVLSDDRALPEAPVDLLGFGHVPELRITPGSHTFTDALVPCGASVDVAFENVGQEELVVTSFSYASELGLMSFDEAGLTAALPLRLAPGERREGMSVTFAPTTSGADLGTLSVRSNDPRGTVEATQTGEGLLDEENAELFTEPGVPPVDVLMLIDQSCSMQTDNLSDVNDGMGPFVDTLEQVSDWQLIQVTQPNGCANQGVLDPTTPNVDQILIDNAFTHAGTGLPYTEALFEHAALALTKTQPGACNDGFLRPGALLHIIVITDESEQSGVDYAVWLDEFEGYVAGPDYLRVSAVVDLGVCGEGAGEYVEAASETGGTILDICTPDWGSEFSNIAAEVLDGIRTYNLAEPAVPDTVVVKVNGVVTTGITVNGTTSVTVNSPPIGEGDLVEITYSVLADCD